MHFVDRKPKGEQPRLLTPHPDTSILYSSCPDGGTGRRKGLKIPGPQGCAGSIPALGTKTKRTGTIQIHRKSANLIFCSKYTPLDSEEGGAYKKSSFSSRGLPSYGSQKQVERKISML